jgi:ferritin-like metal-binding protein YciE
MGHDEIVNLLQQNLQEEEQTAQIAENSAKELLQKARRAEEGEQQEDKGLIEQAKDKLTGQ